MEHRNREAEKAKGKSEQKKLQTGNTCGAGELQGLWESFEITGQVSDYLRYKGIAENGDERPNRFS